VKADIQHYLVAERTAAHTARSLIRCPCR